MFEKISNRNMLGLFKIIVGADDAGLCGRFSRVFLAQDMEFIYISILLCFFPRASERRVLPIVEVCISSSHLHTFSSSHLLSHLLIFTSSLTPSHLHTFSSSHLLSHLLIFTSSLTPSHLHIFSHTFSSSHLLSHLLIFTSSLSLTLSPFSLLFLSLSPSLSFSL